MNRKRIILAEGSKLFADALKVTIENKSDYIVVSEITTGIEAIKQNAVLLPDAAVLGQNLPDLNMLQVLNEIQRGSKKISALLIVDKEAPELIEFIGTAKNIGVIDRSADADELVRALDAAVRGERYISLKVIESLKNNTSKKNMPDLLAQLTQREREILYWLANGYTNKEIANVMILSELTVKNHVSHVLRKLNVSDRTKAAALAWKEGFPSIPEDFFINSSASKL